METPTNDQVSLLSRMMAVDAKELTQELELGRAGLGVGCYVTNIYRTTDQKGQIRKRSETDQIGAAALGLGGQTLASPSPGLSRHSWKLDQAQLQEMPRKQESHQMLWMRNSHLDNNQVCL